MPSGKNKEIFVCSECGYETPRWNGKCAECGEWNTLEQKIVNTAPVIEKKSISGFMDGDIEDNCGTVFLLNDVDTENEIRYMTGVGELDRVLGGGIVKGSLVLLGGDPGIGKSTLLLQMCGYLGNKLKILYISGEESTKQIKLRAERLGVNVSGLYVAAQTDIATIINMVAKMKPELVVIDSIQTMNMSSLNSSPGSVTQVRECTGVLMRLAKSMEIPVIIIGHVNKDGNIAGPKVMEHIVDCVLYFEGERQLSYRILRAVKNRFGSTNEIGVFEMRNYGLSEVENPSAALLSDRPGNVPGTCVGCVMEGSRPIMTEVQALAAKTAFGTPRRMSTGADYNRLILILAVLEKRAGYFFGNLDAYVNIVGGLRLNEPAADLPVALALASAVMDKPINENIVAFGEIGLTGEIRGVSNISERVREAERLGFTKCILPQRSLENIPDRTGYKIELTGVRNLGQAVRLIH